ncbi:MAG TPA: hypothetical protein VGL38_13125 [bacterium]
MVEDLDLGLDVVVDGLPAERPAARLTGLSFVLEDFLVEELLPAELREELVALPVDPFDRRGALAPRLGIFAPERRASL